MKPKENQTFESMVPQNFKGKLLIVCFFSIKIKTLEFEHSNDFYLNWNVSNMFSISDINKDKVDMVVAGVIACLRHNELAPT